MHTPRRSERGEGKVGCIVSLLILVVMVGVAIKIVPAMYANNQLQDYAEDTATRAALVNRASMEAQMQSKARDLEIPEALEPGAITVSVSGERSNGICTITLDYSRKIDLYGAYQFTLETKKTISKPFMDAR